MVVAHLLERRAHLPRVPQSHFLVVASRDDALRPQRARADAAHAGAVRATVGGGGGGTLPRERSDSDAAQCQRCGARR
eukprot:2862668-Prymnesium_polylepis.1